MVAATRTATTTFPIKGVIVHQWAGLDGDDVGSPVLVADHSDKTVQIGAVGGQTHGGATTVLQGSNDPGVAADPATAIWFTLVDPQGNAITTTANKFEQVLENPLYIRPFQSGGTAGDLDVILCAKK